MGKLFIADNNYKKVSVKHSPQINGRRNTMRDNDFDFIVIDNMPDSPIVPYNPWSNGRNALARYDVLFSVNDIPMRMSGTDLVNFIERLQFTLGTITDR